MHIWNLAAIFNDQLVRDAFLLISGALLTLGGTLLQWWLAGKREKLKEAREDGIRERERLDALQDARDEFGRANARTVLTKVTEMSAEVRFEARPADGRFEFDATDVDAIAVGGKLISDKNVRQCVRRTAQIINSMGPAEPHLTEPIYRVQKKLLYAVETYVAAYLRMDDVLPEGQLKYVLDHYKLVDDAWNSGDATGQTFEL
ncbi:hypothetical protein [Herbiconiux liukaitaii]|uniref:hypothetical protein n=1 Tax=Herbiconiux liukaitaii TaxID=3342799 RepID=UPI0035BAF8CB